MPTIDEKRKAVLEQAIRDMGNYVVKLRKPEELPDFDQPVDYEEEKKRLAQLQNLSMLCARLSRNTIKRQVFRLV